MLLSRKRSRNKSRFPDRRMLMKKLAYKVFALVASLVALGLAAGAGLDWT
jgi:hypothetical protein